MDFFAAAISDFVAGHLVESPAQGTAGFVVSPNRHYPGEQMDPAHRKLWLRTALLVGVVYFLVGFGLSELGRLAAVDQVQTSQYVAWVMSAVAFAVHIWYERFRVRSPHGATALHACVAAAFGAFLLAVAANVHGHLVGSGHQRALAIALLAWPVLVAVPAFLAALIASAALGLRRKS